MPGNECWLWPGYIRSNGYGGYVYINGKQWYPHRLFWTMYRGPIPEDLQVDHLCRVRHCVNPDHLELVSQQENLHRGWEARGKSRDHCPQGHPLDGFRYQGKYGYRFCKTCRREREAARRAAKGH